MANLLSLYSYILCVELAYSYLVMDYVALLLGILILLLRLLLLVQSYFRFWLFEASQAKKLARIAPPITTIQIHPSSHLRNLNRLSVNVLYPKGVAKIRKSPRNIAKTQTVARIIKKPLMVHQQGGNHVYYNVSSYGVNTCCLLAYNRMGSK